MPSDLQELIVSLDESDELLVLCDWLTISGFEGKFSSLFPMVFIVLYPYSPSIFEDKTTTEVFIVFFRYIKTNKVIIILIYYRFS